MKKTMYEKLDKLIFDDVVVEKALEVSKKLYSIYLIESEENKDNKLSSSNKKMIYLLEKALEQNKKIQNLFFQ